MLVLGIIFLVLYVISILSMNGAISLLKKEIERLNNRQDEIIKILKK